VSNIDSKKPSPIRMIDSKGGAFRIRLLLSRTQIPRFFSSLLVLTEVRKFAAD